MQLTLHEKAARAFNDQAEKLVQRFAVSSRPPMFRVSLPGEPSEGEIVSATALTDDSPTTPSCGLTTEAAPFTDEPSDSPPVKGQGFPSQRYIAADYTEKDIIGGIAATRVWETDKRGRHISRGFQQDNQVIGLFGDDFRELYRLAERIQKLPGWRDAVSVEAIVERAFDWLRGRYLEQHGLAQLPEQPVAFCDDLRTFFEAQIQPQEIWVPLEGLEIEVDFHFGKIELRTLTAAMMERWRQDWQAWAEKHPERADSWTYEFKQRQKRLQGLVAVCLRIEAEPKRAVEVAYREAERTVAMLRCLSPAIYFPDALTRIALAGWEGDRGREHYFVRDGAIAEWGSGGRNPQVDDDDWRISEKEREETNILGWDEVSQLLREKNLNELEKRAFEALLIYSHSAPASTLPDKLLYVLTALETVLIDSDNPVPNNIAQQIVGEGLALFNGRALKERKDILAGVRVAYDLRHSLLRRDETRDELESLREFFFQSRLFFTYLLQNLHLKTKKAFLEALEVRKLRGGLTPPPPEGTNAVEDVEGAPS